MPTYSYFCENCSSKFELFAYFKDYNEHPECIKCSSKKTNRAYEDDLCTSFVKKSDSELKTIGDLANRNRDRMSSDQKQELHNKHNSYKDQAVKPLPKGMNRIKKKKGIKWT